MDVAGFLNHIQSQSWYIDQLAHLEQIPERAARYGELDRSLSTKLELALEAAGVGRLYSHQAGAVNAISRGENVIVATPSASGKSLCYQIPALEAALENKANRALFLFPTKALTQDQAKSLDAMSPGGRALHAIFDGDTPTEDRARVRRTSQIVLTNPDMLHMGILPNHRTWYRLLRGLKYVVIDEAHIYRGVFGSHVANVIRRLRRICQRLGSRPQFILCSATLANPGELAERLVGLPFTVIDQDGAPYGGKDFALWNPPMIDVAEGSRRSTNTEAAFLLSELLERKVRTMAFVRSRRMAELLYVFVRDKLRETSPAIASRVAPYRATYLPEDRRRIEQDLRDGRLLGLTTTNAMELGVDVGDLDATVITGYPGTVASTWQQAGRSGRGTERSLSMLVAQDGPLDQFLMRNPDAIFGKPHESARILPTNPYILKPQLLCAAYEAPLTAQDDELFETDVVAHAHDLEDEGLLHEHGGHWYLEPDIEYPAQGVNIRSASASFYTLVEEESGAILETMDEWSAFLQLHPGAVYLHRGEPYLVTELDLDSGTAYAVTTDVPYYTQVRDVTETRVLNVYRHKPAGATTAYLGEVSVTTSVVGFAKMDSLTSGVLGEEYLDLPPQSYKTTSLWFDIPEDTLDRIVDEQMDLMVGLHAAEHAAIGVLPLFAICDRNDIGGISTPLHPDTGKPQIFIHDGHPGGVGISETGYERIEELWEATLDVVSQCPCQAGCPSCVQSLKCGNNNEPLDKGVAALLLRDLLRQGGPSPRERRLSSKVPT